MDLKSRSERQKKIRFAVGMAAIDGGKPTAFTQNLLFPMILKNWNRNTLNLENDFKRSWIIV